MQRPLASCLQMWSICRLISGKLLMFERGWVFSGLQKFVFPGRLQLYHEGLFRGTEGLSVFLGSISRAAMVPFRAVMQWRFLPRRELHGDQLRCFFQGDVH